MLLKILNEILRKNMPQIKGRNLVDFLNILKDKNIHYRLGKISCKLLKPMQEDYKKEKVESIKDEINNGVKMPPIIISMENYIIDGHHRYLAYLDLYGQDCTIKCIKIVLPKLKALNIYDKISEVV